MRMSIQRLPSSRRSPSFPRVALSEDMNLKNFPKRLDSKTSCLRITVPENLDLALEGLIRKVLREQPKLDELYAFAADYFDKLLKIRDKVGTKFAAEQLCPFHNDEDAHEMIKLAHTFAKPGIPKAKFPEAEKMKKAGVKAKKESPKSTEKLRKKTQNTKSPAVIQGKSERLPGKKKGEKLKEIEPEIPQALKLEPKTEDVGEDEEFLKSDPIKVLVEKELMGATKAGENNKKKGIEEKAEVQENEKSEGAKNDELSTVVEKDDKQTEEKRADRKVSDTKGEEAELQNVVRDKEEDLKEKDKSATEAVNSTEEQSTNELYDNAKGKLETESEDVENKTETNSVEVSGSSNAGKESEKGSENEIKEEPENIGKAEKKIEMKTEGADAWEGKQTEEPSEIEEAATNPEELCTVVDVLSIKSIEKEEGNTGEEKNGEAKEPGLVKEEGTDEVKIKTEEEPPKEEKVAEAENLEEEAPESVLANKEEKNTSGFVSNGRKEEEKLENLTTEQSGSIDGAPGTENSVEKLKRERESEDNKSNAETEIKETEIKRIDSKDVKPVGSEDQTSAEDNVNGAILASEKEVIKKENEDVVATEEPLKPKDKLLEAPKNKEQVSVPEKAGDEATKSEGSLVVEEERPNGMTNESAAEESVPRKTEDNEDNLKVKEVDSAKDEGEKIGNVTNKEEVADIGGVTKQTKEGTELQNEEVKSEEIRESVKEVQNETEKETDKGVEIANEAGIDKEDDHSIETVLKDFGKKEAIVAPESPDLGKESEVSESRAVESTEPVEKSKLAEQLTGEAGPQEEKQPRDDSLTTGDTQHVITVEEAERVPEEAREAEGVQIKTIQTHYYDTLQVPEQITKEYRVHAVTSSDGLNLENIVKEQVPETSTLLNLPKEDNQELEKSDLEDSLLTPSSNYSLNLSELSVQTISEMFLDSEKQYSGLDREERRYVTKPGANCGVESHAGRQEIEEIIHKTVVPSTVGATPVAPRDEGTINEEAGLENEKKEHGSTDSNEVGGSSNGGRSIDSDTPVISDEVKTVIETQVGEDEEKEREGSEADVGMRTETRTDVPEGVREEDSQEEVRRHANDEPASSEAVPKGSQTSSGESESTMSSTATEIKRSDSAKRHFSSTRTLIATQSLDLDKRNTLLKTRSLSSFRQGVTDFEVWNTIEKELEEAATKIQSNFRGYKTRKKLQRENAVQITTEESSRSTTPVEPREERQQSTGEFHDSIVLSEHPR